MHVVSRFKIEQNRPVLNNLGGSRATFPVVVIGRMQYLSRFASILR